MSLGQSCAIFSSCLLTQLRRGRLHAMPLFVGLLSQPKTRICELSGNRKRTYRIQLARLRTNGTAKPLVTLRNEKMNFSYASTEVTCPFRSSAASLASKQDFPGTVFYASHQC